MRNLLLILLIAIASYSEPLVPTQTYCVHYKIGNSYTTSNVQFVNGYLVCDNWVLYVQSTPNNETRLSRDTTVNTPRGNVYSTTEFLFANNQTSDTIRGVYISHIWGNVCNTRDTLPVWFVKVPCKQTPFRSDL